MFYSSESELENSDSLLSSDSPSGLAESDFYSPIDNKEVLIDMLTIVNLLSRFV